MAKNKEVFLYRRERVLPFEILAGNGTNFVDLCVGDADDSAVYEISITSTESTSRNITIRRDFGGTILNNVKIVTIAANQGNNISSPDPLRLIQVDANFIGSRILDRDQNYYISLPAGQKLQAAVNAALTGANKIVLSIRVKDF